MEPLAETIRSIPIFSGLTREDVAKILGKMEECSFPPGTTVFRQGDRGEAFYFIQSGAVQVVLETVAGASEALTILGPQDWFGEMALLSGDPRSATIVTIKETTLWRLRREAWDELIEKHPTWLLEFCATLSKRLSRADHQYSAGRHAFNALAEEFYNSRSLDQQSFFRRASVLGVIDTRHVNALLQIDKAQQFLAELIDSRFPLIRRVDSHRYELHSLFRQFLSEKLQTVEGSDVMRQLHGQVAEQYETLGEWHEALRHFKETQNWPRVSRLLLTHQDELLDRFAPFIHDVLETIPAEQYLADSQLVYAKAMTLARLADWPGAIRTYKEAITRRARGALEGETVARSLSMADALQSRGQYNEAISCLRNAMSLLEQESSSWADHLPPRYDGAQTEPVVRAAKGRRTHGPANRGIKHPGPWASASRGKWVGGVLGLGLASYLWFGSPDIDLDPRATRLLALLSVTVLFWVFRVLPDYGVALVFALGLILTRLAPAQIVMAGFASTTWFMTLGVLGLGAAITGSGLFYRLSLHLVRLFPLNYYWQIVATGFMGVVVMALIPQQTARTAITSQMLVNLSESLGYKTPSKASTGLFAASFLGLGQLGFLFLTGSTTSLIAWGLLPSDVRAQFTWGFWFVAALPPTAIVIGIVLAAIVFLYTPESEPKISYKMVQTQLEVLGRLSFKECVSFGVLCFTVVGWLTTSYHGIDGAWIALTAFAVLVNTGVLEWAVMRKALDWELLIYMGVTLSIPELLTRAKIDQWLVQLISPLVLPHLDSPALLFVVIALITYVLKLFFTSFLTVVTLCVALLPLSIDIGVSPWVVAMIILMASEVWFFPFQVDWHTLAYSTSQRKGFAYPLMSRINPVYAFAYLAALIAAIPYWRYLGLMP